MDRPYSQISWEISEKAIRGMLLEMACTPKPGLVDLTNNGANCDMDFFLFSMSSAAICQDFYRFALLGIESRLPNEEFLKSLRQKGMATEKKMFRATDGVNTQKGLIFILGVICAVAGRMVMKGIQLSANALSEEIRAISSGICDRELFVLANTIPNRNLTKGEELYLKYGVRGIRGEVEDGLPSVVDHGLPEMRAGLSRGLTLNDSMVNALLRIMSVSMDTNVISRSSFSTLKEKVQPMAAEALELGGIETAEGRESILTMDELFISENINPGGSADLLAATVTIHFLEKAGIV